MESTTAGGDEVALLQAGETGAMIFLSMNKGDTVDLTVNANYEITPSNNNFLGTAYSALFSSFDAAYGSGVEGGVSSSSTVFDEALNGIDMSGKDNSSTAPRAFLNYIFFDQEMNYVRAGFLQITTAAQGIGVHQTISLNDILADREGYILAYLSNENAEEVAIHWDDFTVYHGKTNVVQAQAYYPYGGRFDQYQRTASTKNVFLYNEGAERLEDFSFNLDETKHRIYDPWGRLGWWQIDPYASKFYHLTPYNYAFLNPILYNDPLGDCPPGDPNCQRGMSRSEQAQRAFWNAVPRAAAKGALGVAKMTDLNDAVVLATTITRGDGAVNIDGFSASTLDKNFAIAGALLPAVSGSGLKTASNAITDGLKGSDKVADIHRIGGSSPENLALKNTEKALDPPGISVLKAETPEQAAQQMKNAFPNATKLHDAARVVGSGSEQSIRNAGFDILPDATRKFPNHHRIIHPNGTAGFNKENLQKLSNAFVDKLIE